jgi:hypothetical protein
MLHTWVGTALTRGSDFMGDRKFTATVKEGETDPESRQAPVWILIEPDEDIGLPPDQSITIQFAPGTPYETAQTVASALNKNAHRFKIWKFPKSE